MKTNKSELSIESEKMMLQRQHMSWWAHMRDYAVAFGCALCAVVLGSAGAYWMLVLPLWAVAGYRIAKAVISVLTTDYDLTSDSVTIKSGWLSIKKTKLALKDVRGVSVECSFWNRLVGIGNVIIGSSATAGIDLKVLSVRHPNEFAAALVKESKCA